MTTIPANPLPVKRCACCGLEKPIQEFFRDRSKIDGYAPRCKTCHGIPVPGRAAPRPRTTRTCEHCGASFKASNTQKRPNTYRYCSRACKNAANTRPLAERFWSHVDTSGGPDACWPWTARRTDKGYGLVNRGLDGRGHYASRVAYELTHGPIADERLIVGHQCDNPPCCNPAHLWLGTQAENLADARRKGRRPSRNQVVET